MNVSFEDLANDGLPDEFPEPKSKQWLRRLVLVLVVLGIGWSAAAFYYKIVDAPRPLPESAKRLLVLEGDVPDGVLPHRLDDATEFEASFGNLKAGYKAPKFREARFEEAVEVVAVSVSGKSSTVEAVKPRHVVLLESMELPEATATAVLTNSVVPPAVEVRELSSDSLVDLQFDRDWEGVVLVPNNVKLARAYTSEVRLRRVEAHPIDGGRLRVWSRVENLTDRDMFVETACEFRFTESGVAPLRFRPGLIPANGAMDVYFVSQRDGVDAYTLMVKQ